MFLNHLCYVMLVIMCFPGSDLSMTLGHKIMDYPSCYILQSRRWNGATLASVTCRSPLEAQDVLKDLYIRVQDEEFDVFTEFQNYHVRVCSVSSAFLSSEIFDVPVLMLLIFS